MAWQYHLTSWRSDLDLATGEDTWFPNIPDLENFGVIDLRPTKGLNGPDGFCLVATPDIVRGFKAMALKFGVDPSDTVPSAVTRQIGNQLGIALDGRTVKELLYELLTHHASDADPGKWNHLKPTAGRKGASWKRYEEIYLGELIERRLHSVVKPSHNTVIMDDQFMHVANGEALSGEAPDTVNTPGEIWDDTQFDWQGDGSNNVENNASHSDTYSQIDTGDADIKVMIEVESIGENAQFFYTIARSIDLGPGQNQSSTRGYRFAMTGAPELRIIRKDASPTVISSSTSVSYSTGTKYLLGGRADGSTLVSFWETPFTTSPADASVTATDSSYLTNTYAGFGMFGGQNPQRHRVSQFIVDDDPTASTLAFPTELLLRRPNTLLRM